MQSFLAEIVFHILSRGLCMNTVLLILQVQDLLQDMLYCNCYNEAVTVDQRNSFVTAVFCLLSSCYSCNFSS